MSLPWDANENQEVVETEYRPFRCPSMREGNGAAINLTSYVGVAGIGQDAAALPLGDKRCGFFGYERKIRMPDDIKDGTSHTLVVIETGRDNGPWARGGSATVRGLDSDELPYIGAGRQFGGHSASRGTFRGSEEAVQAALADGSTRIIGRSIDPRILEALATIAGGEEIPKDY